MARRTRASPSLSRIWSSSRRLSSSSPDLPIPGRTYHVHRRGESAYGFVVTVRPDRAAPLRTGAVAWRPPLLAVGESLPRTRYGGWGEGQGLCREPAPWRGEPPLPTAGESLPRTRCGGWGEGARTLLRTCAAGAVIPVQTGTHGGRAEGSSHRRNELPPSLCSAIAPLGRRADSEAQQIEVVVRHVAKRWGYAPREPVPTQTQAG